MIRTAIVQEVMPDEGELYEADLTAGIYKGGVHLPQGPIH